MAFLDKRYFKQRLSKAERAELEFKEGFERQTMVLFDPAMEWKIETVEQRRARWDREFQKKDPKNTIGFSGNWGRVVTPMEKTPKAPPKRKQRDENEEDEDPLKGLDIEGWKASLALSKKRQLQEEKKALMAARRKAERQELYDRIGGQLLYRPKGVEG